MLGAALLIIAALHDIAARTVPNWIPAVLVAAALLLRLSDHALPGALIAFAAVLLLALLCWWRGWMGGGDVKLLAAVALLLPPARVPGGIAAIAICGAVLALSYLALGRIVKRPGAVRPAGLLARAWRAERFRLRRGGPLPYAVAIAAGALLTLFGSAA